MPSGLGLKWASLVDGASLQPGSKLTCASRFAGVAIVKRCRPTGRADASGGEIYCTELKRTSALMPMDRTSSRTRSRAAAPAAGAVVLALPPQPLRAPPNGLLAPGALAPAAEGATAAGEATEGAAVGGGAVLETKIARHRALLDSGAIPQDVHDKTKLEVLLDSDP